MIAALVVALPVAALAGTVVPTVYEQGHFFAAPTLASGKTLKLNVDTGGGSGFWFLTTSAAAPLHLAPVHCDGGGSFAATPAFAPGKGLPPMKPRVCDAISVNPDCPGGDMDDGSLSAWFLAQGTWTFDYPARRLTLEDKGWEPASEAHGVSLGFVENPHGDFGTPYPRITIKVAGEPVDFLLDTGATAHPTREGRKAMGTGVAANGFAAGSYITTSVMNLWHDHHPDWQVVDNADDLFGAGKATRAIRVPSVDIAGWAVGPVWFTERRDSAFGEDGMSGMMDSEVHGSVGGNLFAHFRLVMDYPRRKAWFTCIEGCKAAK
ncbi:hypothetical protein [Luteibacter yeojuensis]|nr:hypothetical protein [Luteibacter yeojuensis]